MKAELNQDIIIAWSTSADATEVGSKPPGVGLERLRFDGTKIVDLADLTLINVVKTPGAWELHAVSVPGSQEVVMNYADRKQLTADGGLYRVLTSTEQLNILKTTKKAEIKRAFETAADTLTTVSTLGFTIDATREASDNVNKLIKLGVEPITFRAADNTFHGVSLADLAAMDIEIIQAAFATYQQKWQLEALVDAAETAAEINAITW